MTIELNSKQKYALIESILTRNQRIDSLINLFNQKEEEKIATHYEDEKILLEELLQKLNCY
jgi:hypothetical protein